MLTVATGAAASAATESAEPVIDLVDVRKVYESGTLRVEALRGVSLRIAVGEYVAIMGPSGSGKSTLMHIIGCLDIATDGTFLLAGEDVSEMTEAELAEVRNRRVGFVFQQFNLLASLTALRNVELPLAYAGVSREVRRRRALDALARVDLADRVEHRPGELSGGQQQRVAVARALISRPSVVFADEPSGNLDSKASNDVLGLLRHAVDDFSQTVVMVTHDAHAASFADRLLVLADGRIMHDGGAVTAEQALDLMKSVG
jgi:putative ABC transport system ATP-binding protein